MDETRISVATKWFILRISPFLSDFLSLAHWIHHSSVFPCDDTYIRNKIRNWFEIVILYFLSREILFIEFSDSIQLFSTFDGEIIHLIWIFWIFYLKKASIMSFILSVGRLVMRQKFLEIYFFHVENFDRGTVFHKWSSLLLLPISLRYILIQ
jgi:hypothetical protein